MERDSPAGGMRSSRRSASGRTGRNRSACVPHAVAAGPRGLPRLAGMPAWRRCTMYDARLVLRPWVDDSQSIVLAERHRLLRSLASATALRWPPARPAPGPHTNLHVGFACFSGGFTLGSYYQGNIIKITGRQTTSIHNSMSVSNRFFQ